VSDSAHDDPPLSGALAAGLRGRCPRCGQGLLFRGFLDVAPRCTNCGLDYGFVDAGDGPAVFVILIVGFIVVGIALVVSLNTALPYWLMLTIFVPLTLALCLGLLRPLKGVLIALQFKHKAREGRVEAP
jgi:uncharacterized protein (DUF983 family)